MTETRPAEASTLAGSGERIPDFYIVGHAKSGTTALYEMLKTHPQIFMPELKETRFFAQELHASIGLARHHPVTLEDYRTHFAAAGATQRIGEASPSYIRSRLAAQRIAELRPDARIIAILREPASFLHSLHLQLLQSQVETEKSFRRALSLEAERRAQRERGDSSVQQGLMYLDHVRYVEQLRRFHDVFPREQVQVIIYDDFRTDNDATVRDVLRFLDVDERSSVEAVEAHPSVEIRSPRLSRAVRSLYEGRGPLARGSRAAIKAFTPRSVRLRALGLHRRVQRAQPEPPDEALMLELRGRVKGEVLALSDYLDRDLVKLWGYEQIV